MTIERAGDSAALRKARGAFFTPAPVTEFLARWGIRERSDRILEPSCGDGAILAAAIDRLRALGGRSPLRAHELHEETAAAARMLLDEKDYPGEVRLGDFLATPAEPIFDAVLGNPPYVRYQGFTGEARATGLAAALAQGVRLSRLSSSWAPFVVHAAAYLKPHGRLALVLPAELLSANYAQEVRDFLLARFAEVSVVLIERRVFPGVQTEALLLLAEGIGGTRCVRFGVVDDGAGLADIDWGTVWEVHPGARWTAALVSAETGRELAEVTASGLMTPLSSWGRLSLGAVTGNNRFFTLSPAEARGHGLKPADLTPISPAGSGHLRALAFTGADHATLGAADAKTLLFRPTTLDAAARAYVALGEERGVDRAYKCRVRRPWWRTPLPPPPDAFFTYMNQATPQLAANPDGLHYLNSVHGLYLADDCRGLADVLALAALNTVTALSAEVAGRAYGGGVLKMEPREAAQLLVPSVDAVRRHEGVLRELLPPARAALRAGRLSEVRARVDGVLLADRRGERLAAVREAHAMLSGRRRARSSDRRARRPEGGGGVRRTAPGLSAVTGRRHRRDG